ncbi:MAG: hypothetical protein FRX49_00340 [Trebouxia sp. A1-2]|nr:MAG: hypothetical protein FRX49_00340 [Trebouxia sp. A1-2]
MSAKEDGRTSPYVRGIDGRLLKRARSNAVSECQDGAALGKRLKAGCRVKACPVPVIVPMTLFPCCICTMGCDIQGVGGVLRVPAGS